ncbi:hypothetical protein ABZ499_33205 [Streptomyces sp. NPDC019990]|uniref:hypothetical protein n=1 Tax=Streptomyces sp. NPDC019990 TaxID=3154693 RepID=UPI0033D871F2
MRTPYSRGRSVIYARPELDHVGSLLPSEWWALLNDALRLARSPQPVTEALSATGTEIG